jgi:hypothetical protein
MISMGGIQITLNGALLIRPEGLVMVSTEDIALPT